MEDTSVLGQPCSRAFCAWLRHYCTKITTTSLPLLAALNAEETSMNISWFSSWMPLNECPYEVASLGEGVYKLDDQLYIYTRPHKKNYEKGNDSPYITLLVLAASDGAALRYFNREASFDDGAEFDLSSLPNLGLGPISYGFAKRLPDVYESASYSNKGQFVKVVLSVGNIELCYRSNELKDEMVPFAIIVRDSI